MLSCISLTPPTIVIRMLQMFARVDPDEMVDALLACDRGKRLTYIVMDEAAPLDKALAACGRYMAACPGMLHIGCGRALPIKGDAVAAGARLRAAAQTVCSHGGPKLTLDLSHNDLSAILVPLLDGLRGAPALACLYFKDCSLDDSHIPALADFFIASPQLEGVFMDNKWSHEGLHKLLRALAENTVLTSIGMRSQGTDEIPFLHSMGCIFGDERAIRRRNEKLVDRVNRTALAAVAPLRLLLHAKSASRAAPAARSTVLRGAPRVAPRDATVICNDCSDSCQEGCSHGPAANGLRRSKRRTNITSRPAAPRRTRDSVPSTDIPGESFFARLPLELRIMIAQHHTGDPGALTAAQWSRLVTYAADRRTLKRTRMPPFREWRFRTHEGGAEIDRWLRARGCFLWEGPPPPWPLKTKKTGDTDREGEGGEKEDSDDEADSEQAEDGGEEEDSEEEDDDG